MAERALDARCPRCQTTTIIDERVLPALGALMTCAQCAHAFHVAREGAPPSRVLGCPRCRTVYFLEKHVVPAGGAEVQCSQCQHVFFAAGEGAGRWTEPKLAPINAMHADAVADLDDASGLQVLADALLEQGDPQGELIALALEEERTPSLPRRAKMSALIREHGATWTPPGARITAFHRGLPSELEWSGPTDPAHVGWRAARGIHVALSVPPERSVFELPRPHLRRLTGLQPQLFSHVAAAAPAYVERLEAQLFGSGISEVVDSLARLSKLRRVSIQTTPELVDLGLDASQVRQFLTGARRLGLEVVRLSLPALTLDVLSALVEEVSSLDLRFVVPCNDRRGQPALLAFDVRRRALRVPRHVVFSNVEWLTTVLGRTLRGPFEIERSPTDEASLA